MISYRGLDDADKALVSQWLKNDPEHQSADSRLFTDQAPGRSQFVLERDKKPVFYVTVENVARVHIQFNPQGSFLTNVKTLLEGFKWLLKSLHDRGYHEMLFDSRFKPLIRLCEKALGFVKTDQDYSVRL